MPKFAFIDQGDGYYEVEADSLETLPDWTKTLNQTLPRPPYVVPPPTALQQIRAIESRPDVADAMARASRQFLLKTWFVRAKAMPAAASLTDEQIEIWCRANDKTYKPLAEAEDAIKLLRGQP